MQMMPLLFGMIPALDNFVTGGAALFGSFFALLALMIYAVWNEVVKSGVPLSAASFRNGFYYTFYYSYDWPSFTIGLVGSVVGVLLYVAVREGYYAYTRQTKPIPYHLQVDPYAHEKKKAVAAVPVPSEEETDAKTIAVL
jgi:hypothetical protein